MKMASEYFAENSHTEFREVFLTLCKLGFIMVQYGKKFELLNFWWKPRVDF
jgi:hypothetical protein